jgi:RHS repeat-associated protein
VIYEHYRYTAFGEPEIYDSSGNKLATSAIKNEILWNSRRYDSTTDLYYYKYRHYTPALGRWPSRDPIEEDGGVNLYGFAFNNSFYWYDFLGAEPRPHTDPAVDKKTPAEASKHYHDSAAERMKIYKDNEKDLKPFRNDKGIPEFKDPNNEKTWRRIYYDDGAGTYLGECASICKKLARIPGSTSGWKPGVVVWGKEKGIAPGTAIASFANGKTFNTSDGHAAIYTGLHGNDERGPWVEVYEQYTPDNNGKCPQIRKLYKSSNNHNGGPNLRVILK